MALKNSLQGDRAWAHLVEITVNANTVAFFTSHAETVTHNGQTYAPVPMVIGPIEQQATGQLPTMTVDVWNFRGQAFQFAKDNDLSLNDVVVRIVNLSLTTSGAEDSIRLQILGSAFTEEVGRFTLGHDFNYDAEGPRRTYNRRDFPSIPYNFRQFAIL